MPFHPLPTALLCVALLPPLAAQAQLPDEDLIIVSGTRLEQTARETGSSVSVLTADDIEALGADFALDAIAAAPGVTINQNGPFGGAASVRIRGAGSEQTLVLIDGVPVNDASAPGGGFDFARLDTDNIERIEILKGPQSTLWGTDAIGGVVAITTKRPAAGSAISGFLEGGSFATVRGGASLAHGGERGSLRLAGTGIKTSGISKADEENGNSEDDGYEAATLSASGRFAVTPNAELNASVLYSDATADFDSFVFGAEGNVGDGDETSETQDLVTSIGFRNTLLDGRLTNQFQAGYTSIDRQNFSSGVPSFGAEGERTILRYQGTIDVAQGHTLAVGAEREETDANGDTTSITGLFALYEAKPIDALTLTAGVRNDDHERFGNETTARVAAAYTPTDSLTLRASWGQGFKAPTLFQTTFFCCGATAANGDLAAETSDAVDVGADWRQAEGKASAGITYFDQDTENLITFTFADGTYTNIAKATSRGVEVYGALALNSWLRVRADYAYIDAEDGAGTALPRVPKHSGDVLFTLSPDGPFGGTVLIRHNGEEETTSGTTLAGWTRVDATATYRLGDRVELYGRIENVTDETYQQVLGYGTPPVSGTLGIRLRSKG